MEVVYPYCAGLDVHKRTVAACVLTPSTGTTPQRITRTFSTVTRDLLALADWLLAQGVTHVAMESTGEFVRRITARAIPSPGRMGSEGNPWVNN